MLITVVPVLGHVNITLGAIYFITLAASVVALLIVRRN